MARRFPATRTAGMKTYPRLGSDRHILQFDEHAPDLFDRFIRAQNMLVAQEEPETQLPGLNLGFVTSVERSIFGPQLFCRIASHPKNVFMSHHYASLHPNPNK